MRYRRDIDGLRAVAVLPVLLFHFGVTTFAGGFTGVDVFFVISGYVIALSLEDDLDKGRFGIGRFYYKRARRILPALTATMIATTIAAAILLLPSDLMDYAKSVIAVNLFASNIYFWKASGYFAADAQLRPLLHTWSLSVEEQYYLFMPILIWAIHRYAKSRWLTFLTPLMLGSFALSVFSTTVAPTANFFLLPTRAWELLIGATLALRAPPVPRRDWAAELVAFAGAALILIGILTLSEQSAFPGLNALYPCVGAGLLIYVGRRETLPLVNRLLATRPFVWIGLISYSLYLVHWPIAALARYATLRGPTPPEIVAMLASALVLAWASWRFVEQPFRQPRPGWTQGRVLAGAAAVLVAGIGVGAVGLAAQGFPQRHPGFAERVIAGNDQWKTGSCFNDGNQPLSTWSLAACTRTGAGKARVMLWGDSFAAQYIPGLIAEQGALGATIVQYTYAGCPPVLTYVSFARPDCRRFNARAIDIIRQGRIDTVVLSARWTDQASRGFGHLRSTIDALNALGVRVYVLGQSPEFSSDVQKVDYISGNYRRPVGRWQLSFDPAINAQLAAVAHDVRFIDPLPALCQDRICDYRRGDTFYYADFGHFSAAGSRRAVAAYFPRFR